MKLYTKGFTKPEDYRVGIEYERLPISATSFKAIDYWSENGIKQILEGFAKEETWDFIFEGKNPIGLKKVMTQLLLNPVRK